MVATNSELTRLPPTNELLDMSSIVRLDNAVSVDGNEVAATKELCDILSDTRVDGPSIDGRVLSRFWDRSTDCRLVRAVKPLG
jgi:hypothetical protein